jgi:ribonuclease-3
MPKDDLHVTLNSLRSRWTAPEAEAHFAAALTRRAWLDERAARGLSQDEASLGDHEPYEWLGDRVLNFIVADRLWRSFPRAEPGRLAKALDELVRTGTLAKIAREVGLDRPDAVRAGAGERLQGQASTDKALASHVEAVIGAAYLAGGITGAAAMVEALFEGWWPGELPEATAAVCGDAMSRLNEVYQGRYKAGLPKQAWTVGERAPGAQEWSATLKLPATGEDFTALGWFQTKQEAKQATAAVAVAALGGGG